MSEPVKKGAWSHEEDEKLRQAVNQHGYGYEPSEMRSGKPNLIQIAGYRLLKALEVVMQTVSVDFSLE